MDIQVPIKRPKFRISIRSHWDINFLSRVKLRGLVCCVLYLRLREKSMQKSEVWEYFTRDGDKARCKVGACKAVLLATKGTSSLFYHLQHKHKILRGESSESSTSAKSTNQLLFPVQQEVLKQSDEPKSKKQKTLLECFSSTSLEKTVARLAAVDGLTIRQITRSTFIHEALVTKFPRQNIPVSEHSMMVLIENFYEQVKDEIKQKILRLKAQDVKFSATLDEWTSMKNIRFININIHFSIECNKTNFINLGMIEINGSCPSDRMLSMVSHN